MQLHGYQTIQRICVILPIAYIFIPHLPIEFRRLCAILPVVHQGYSYSASAISPIAHSLLCAISPIVHAFSLCDFAGRTPLSTCNLAGCVCVSGTQPCRLNHCSALPVDLRCLLAISPVVWASVAYSLADCCDFLRLPWCHPDMDWGGLPARACKYVLHMRGSPLLYA